MHAEERRTRFHARIETERAVLGLVNAYFGEANPLAGLTKEAIESWAARAGTEADSRVRETRRFLLEISKRTRMLADDSREVFTVDRSPPNGAAVILQQQLKAYLET